jgi:hypothetical protein
MILRWRNVYFKRTLYVVARAGALPMIGVVVYLVAPRPEPYYSLRGYGGIALIPHDIRGVLIIEFP